MSGLSIGLAEAPVGPVEIHGSSTNLYACVFTFMALAILMIVDRTRTPDTRHVEILEARVAELSGEMRFMEARMAQWAEVMFQSKEVAQQQETLLIDAIAGLTARLDGMEHDGVLDSIKDTLEQLGHQINCDVNCILSAIKKLEFAISNLQIENVQS